MVVEILAALRAAAGQIESDGYVSGQELCEKLDVSRTAVWKAVNQLKEAGYVIDSVRNRGYRLCAVPDILSAEELVSIRKTEWAGRGIYYFPVIGSTNTKAKQFAEEGHPAGTLVVAGRQEEGRGRRGRSWDSPEGSGIFMTLLLRPGIEPNNASMLTLVAALAVARAIQEQMDEEFPHVLNPKDNGNRLDSGNGGIRSGSEDGETRLDSQDGSGDSGETANAYAVSPHVGIKWPNDIVMNGRKVCGILTEMSAQVDYVDYVVVGIGINVNNESFPDDIAQTATSLYMETGERYRRAALIEGILEQFEKYYGIFMQDGDLGGLKGEYDAYLANVNQAVRVLDPKDPFEGVAAGITDRGELIVDTHEGRRLVSSGEVSVRGIYGYV